MSASARPVTRTVPRGALVTAGVAVLVFVLDQLSKSWAVNALADGHDIDVVWTLRFHLTFNSGMAFSQARGLGPVIGVVAIIVVVGLLISLRRAGSMLGAVAVGMVVGGACGNIADRLFRSGDGGFLSGRVVDFVDLQWYPVFNVADAAVVIGGILLLLTSVLTARPEP